MGITTITLNRENLVNKRSSHYIEGEILKIIGLRAYLKEAISYENGAYTAVHVFDGNGNELTEGVTGDYILNNEGATIDFNSQPTVAPYTATYYGVGSIIWADDVNELQDAVKQLNNAGLAKDGSVTMTGNLNLGTNNITNVGTVDGVDISTHDHSNGQGNLIPAEGLANNSVITSKILDGNVTTAKINDSAVTTVKIADANVTTAKLAAAVMTTLLNNIYPVGSIYITENGTCPISTVYGVGTWELVSSGRVLQGADQTHATGTTIEAGLPNHYHGVGKNTDSNSGEFLASRADSWNPTAVTVTTINNGGLKGWNGSGNDTGHWNNSVNHVDYAANMVTSLTCQEANTSTGGGVYNNSTTVQPPAYVVNIFKRIS